MTDKIQRLMNSSRQAIKDCCLPNGAVVAANSRRKYFPKQAKNYYYVWPRDGMYICMAAKILDIKMHEKYFSWCMKAEGWSRTGLFYEKYFVNGKKARFDFQPDQTGSVLFALWHCYKDTGVPKKFERLLRKSADGLCRIWKKDHFTIATQDLWEERFCFPDLKENFSYSLAACSRGLWCANQLMPNRKWLRTSDEMKKTLLKNSKGCFTRASGRIGDPRTDGSLVGLTWPFGIVPAGDRRMVKTVKNIEKSITKDMGVYRYEHDEYDGWKYKDMDQRKKGAGYWPLITFWMAIYWTERGNRRKALKYYDKVLRDVGSKRFIPEQIFDNDLQVSVCPLGWSHSMFVIASEKLGFI
jgi:GH15 family glucan-1,4-alpha-glucosidase